MTNGFQTINGKEKEKHLAQLDSALAVAEKQLMHEKDPSSLQAIAEFGKKNSWDWSRLSGYRTMYQAISSNIACIRHFYQLLGWQYSEDPNLNKGYFDELNINPKTGLAWQFDFEKLQRLKKEAEDLAAQLPQHGDIAQDLTLLLTTDYIPIEEVESKARELHQKAMRRNYLELLREDGTVENGFVSMPINFKVQKLIPLGAETLWNMSFTNFSLATGMFHVYNVEFWQDVREHEVDEVDGQYNVSDTLKKSLRFGEQNAAWYILRSLDEAFESIHPVHVARAIVGPFENCYRTAKGDIPPLEITDRLIKDDNDAGFLRMAIQYTFAPNHTTDDEKIRQVVYRENWHDELIICPTKYAPQVSESILGTRVKVLEY